MGFNVFRTECKEFLEGCGELKARVLRCYCCFWLISPCPRFTPVSSPDCIHLDRNVIIIYGHYWAFAQDREKDTRPCYTIFARMNRMATVYILTANNMHIKMHSDMFTLSENRQVAGMRWINDALLPVQPSIGEHKALVGFHCSFRLHVNAVNNSCDRNWFCSQRQ